MKYTINQLYEDLHQKVFDVYNVFIGFFGEENVDLQLSDTEQNIKNGLVLSIITNLNKPLECTEEDYNKEFEITEDALERIKSDLSEKKVNIYVWWKKVTVTNEYNKSIDIQDLYAKIELQLDGRIPFENRGFLLNRATYSSEQFCSGYMHSHINIIPKDHFEIFQLPCLGRGPINGTITTLKSEYDETTWMLFCQELSLYVTVESISGGPYHRLESVRGSMQQLFSYKYCFQGTNLYQFNHFFTHSIFKDFIKYYIEYGHLTLSFNRGKFTYGMPYFNYIIDISNAFIDFYNKYLYNEKGITKDNLYGKFLHEVFIINNKFYRSGSSIDSYSINSYKGKYVLTFKGKDIYTKIFDPVSRDNIHYTTIIDPDCAMYILKHILKIINFRYKNEHNEATRNIENPASAYQRVCYI